MSSGHLAYKTSTLSSSSPLSIIWWDNSITMACSQSLCLFISLFLLPLIHCRNQVICLLVSPTFWMCVHFHIVSSNLFFFLLPFSYKWALEDWFDWDSDFFFFLARTLVVLHECLILHTSGYTQSLTTPPFLRPRWIGGLGWFAQF